MPLARTIEFGAKVSNHFENYEFIVLDWGGVSMFNPLNPKLNPICHLLALLGAHYIFHVIGLRVKLRQRDVKVPFFALRCDVIQFCACECSHKTV